MELLPLALVYPLVYSDLATSTKNGSPSPEVGNVYQQYQNLFWPLRFLPDPIAKRVHVLTDRGVFWELPGAEPVTQASASLIDTSSARRARVTGRATGVSS